MLLVAIFWKYKLYLQVLGHVLYAAIMLPKFSKITSLEKKIFYTGFQQATRLSFTGFSSRWNYRLRVSVGLPAHRLLVGVGVYHLYLKGFKDQKWSKGPHSDQSHFWERKRGEK